MHFLLVLAVVLLTIGHFWFAGMLWINDQRLMALVLLAIPMPLVGLFTWWHSDWDRAYKRPAIAYFSGYALASLVGLLGPPAI